MVDTSASMHMAAPTSEYKALMEEDLPQPTRFRKLAAIASGLFLLAGCAGMIHARRASANAPIAITLAAKTGFAPSTQITSHTMEGQVHATTGETRRDRTLTSTKPWKAKVTDRDGKTEEITMKPAVKDGKEIKDLYTMSFEESHRDMVFHGGFSIGQDSFFTCFGFPITIEVTEAALTTDVGLKWRVKKVSEGKGDNGPVGEIVPIEK